MVESRIQTVREQIREAAARGGRDAAHILLVAVTKNVPIATMQEALDHGIRDFGENRVQEFRDKAAFFAGDSTDINWHFVGHLQRNKVKYIIDAIHLIHSVDSPRLAEEIEKRAAQRNKVQDVLIQVNFGHDSDRFGFGPEDTKEFIAGASKLRHLSVRGLMTMAPLGSAEKARGIFIQAKQLFEQVKYLAYPHAPMQYLSMGMSNDFEVAIEEGSNIVRIGTAIFGGLRRD